MKRIILAVTLFALLPAFAQAEQWADNASIRLTREETVQQATQSVDGSIAWDRVSTCGRTAPSGPWQCRLIGYVDGTAWLQLAFHLEDDGVWRLANWGVGP